MMNRKKAVKNILLCCDLDYVWINSNQFIWWLLYNLIFFTEIAVQPLRTSPHSKKVLGTNLPIYL